MSPLSKNTQLKQADSPSKANYMVYLSTTIYIITILAVVGFLYQSLSTSFFGN